MNRLAPALAASILALAACSSGGSTAPSASPGATTSTTTAPVSTPGYPDSIVVLGHSGATGGGSDPMNLSRDARENSWATGTNPTVNSVYLRVLARNPAVVGHNVNLAKGGSGVDDLLRQAEGAVELDPLPELVLIETIDNDIRCDGTDPQNYEPFGATLDSALDIIEAGAPDAKIFFVSQWGTVSSYMNTFAGSAAVVSANSGDYPCATFDESGAPKPDGIAYLQDVVDQYFAVIVARCEERANCFTDESALRAMAVEPDLVGPDYNHLSIAGHMEYAAIAWPALTGKGVIPS